MLTPLKNVPNLKMATEDLESWGELNKSHLRPLEVKPSEKVCGGIEIFPSPEATNTTDGGSFSGSTQELSVY